MVQDSDSEKEGPFLAVEQQKVLVEKITELRRLLADSTIDDKRSLIGSEPFYKPVLDGKEKDAVKRKLVELVNKL